MTSERTNISLPSGLFEKWKDCINQHSNLQKPQTLRNLSHSGVTVDVKIVQSPSLNCVRHRPAVPTLGLSHLTDLQALLEVQRYFIDS